MAVLTANEAKSKAKKVANLISICYFLLISYCIALIYAYIIDEEQLIEAFTGNFSSPFFGLIGGPLILWGVSKLLFILAVGLTIFNWIIVKDMTMRHFTEKSRCKKCGAVLSTHLIGENTLTQNVVTEKEYYKDSNGYEKSRFKNYHVGEREYFYRCNRCGYETTVVAKYKELIR